MARYTFHWTFTANGNTYHIYGSKNVRRNHPYGATKTHVQGVVDPYYRINLLTLNFLDHGMNNENAFLNDRPAYENEAQNAANSGKHVFIINCTQGVLRTTLMSLAIYMRLVGCDINTAVNVFRGTLNGAPDPGDSTLKIMINFNAARANLARRIFS